MPSTVYTAIISPHEVQIGDTVLIKGVLQDNASEFSINFVNEILKSPTNITYHFKWILDENVLVQNYKDNGNWIRHVENSANPFIGTKFELLFSFQDDMVYVYKMFDNTPTNYIASYELYFNISEIKALQVWGDVKKITELTYKYG